MATNINESLEFMQFVLNMKNNRRYLLYYFASVTLGIGVLIAVLAYRFMG